MHVIMPRMHGSHMGAPYVRSWHGEGTRLVLWHMWPMIAVGWLIFMLGAMMGTKSTAMKQQMMSGPCEPGMGGPGWKRHMMGGQQGPGWMGRKGMMTHHHHGEASMPCTDPSCAEESEKMTGGAGI